MQVSAKTLPEPLPDSGDASRFVDKSTGKTIAKVLPGYFYVTKHPEEIMTVLGSCIAACIRDPFAGIGGMNHFMLPIGENDRTDAWGAGMSAANRFGNFAMENLINALIKHGAQKNRLEVKLFGGGRVLNISSDIGAKNIAFVKDYIDVENLTVSASNVGDNFARKVIYNPLSGRTRMKRLQESYNGLVVSQENKLLESIKQEPVAGSVELF
ncbi:MAG: chemoreceptor glutamine deamidase CheD [Woeseiaceae bacterium]